MSGNTQAALAANLEMNENILSKIHYFVYDTRFAEICVLFGRPHLSVQSLAKTVLFFCAKLEQKQFPFLIYAPDENPT